MIAHRRRQPAPRVPMLTVLIGSLWLAGCVSSNALSPQASPAAADAYTQLGVAYLERDNLPRALNALDRALDIAPRHAEALQGLALVYQRQGESALANEYFQKAVNAEPDFTRGRNNYAAFLFGQGKLNDACEQLEIASEDAQYTNRAQLFTNLGQCYLALDEFNKARARLERAQSIDPRNSRGYLMLAELEYSQGNYAQAWSPLQTYLQLAEPNQAALEMAFDIAQKRGEHDAAADYQRLLGND